MVSQCGICQFCIDLCPFIFFPSIIRNSYMEEMSGGNNYMTDTEEWMINKLIIICLSERIRDYVQKEVDYISFLYKRSTQHR